MWCKGVIIVEKSRLNLMVPKEISDKMRDMAKEYGMTLSGVVSMIAKQYFDQQALLKRSEEFPDLVKYIKEMAKNKGDN